MSNGAPPIESAPVPPSIAGIPQPVIVAGGQSLPPSFPLGTAGTWLPPPQVGMGGNAPFSPSVVVPAPVPPSTAGFPQPQYKTGSALLPTAASLFPSFSAAGPSPPIIYSVVQPPPPVPLPLPTTPGTSPIPIALGGWGLYGGPNPAVPWPKMEVFAEEEAFSRSMNENGDEATEEEHGIAHRLVEEGARLIGLKPKSKPKGRKR